MTSDKRSLDHNEINGEKRLLICAFVGNEVWEMQRSLITET